MQNGQIPFPLHLLLRNPPLIWKSSAKSGKKSGKLWKQEIWFHAKMPNRLQPPPQQPCQKIFFAFSHRQKMPHCLRAHFSLHTSFTPLLTTSQLSSSGLLKHHAKCQLYSFSHSSTWLSHMSTWLLSAVLWPLDTSVILIVQFDKPMSVRSSHMSARTSHISTILLSAVFRSLDLQDSYYPVWQVNVS